MAGKRKQRRGVEHHKKGLGDQMEAPEAQGVRVHPRSSKKRRATPDSDEEEALPGGMSQRIMKEAAAQQDEVRAEAQAALVGRLTQAPEGPLRTTAAGSDSDEEADGYASNDADSWYDGGEVEVAPEDEEALAAFMAPHDGAVQQRTLADMILDKIKAKQAQPCAPSQAGHAPQETDPKVAQVYTSVGKILSRYTAGRVPKAFKIIPTLRNWEEVLLLTDPEHWTPHAVYQATRLFVSNLNAKMAQRFLALVLLPHVRNDILEHRRCHFALYQAMKKATYKPDAFFKGLLLPLCQSGDCSLREAFILSSVLRRVSLPVLHSAAALLRIADMEFTGTNSFFIRVLLDKKYALPYRVIDGLVDHFMGFKSEQRTLPVVWHQSLLCFVQRYKHEIRREDQEALRGLVKAQSHHQVTPEIQRELEAARARGDKPPAPGTPVTARRAGKQPAEDLRDLPPVVLMDED